MNTKERRIKIYKLALKNYLEDPSVHVGMCYYLKHASRELCQSFHYPYLDPYNVVELKKNYPEFYSFKPTILFNSIEGYWFPTDKENWINNRLPILKQLAEGKSNEKQ